jgi:nitrogen fixation protein NifU and related proteins
VTPSDSVRDLYQETILDHHKRPRNFRVLEGATARAAGHNPLCGDRVEVFVRMDGDKIVEVSFQGSGCAISKASASMMTDSVAGLTRGQAAAVFDQFQALVTGTSDVAPEGPAASKLEVFVGVRDYPSRVKCATLAWHALQAALRQEPTPVSTE